MSVKRGCFQQGNCEQIWSKQPSQAKKIAGELIRISNSQQVYAMSVKRGCFQQGNCEQIRSKQPSQVKCKGNWNVFVPSKGDECRKRRNNLHKPIGFNATKPNLIFTVRINPSMTPQYQGKMDHEARLATHSVTRGKKEMALNWHLIRAKTCKRGEVESRSTTRKRGALACVELKRTRREHQQRVTN
jgi:hypothetical protein